MKKNAFTLIEVLTALAVISVLTGLILADYRSTQVQFSLERSADKLAQDLRRAEEMAISAKEIAGAPLTFRGGHGIFFQKDSQAYIIFSDLDDDKDYDGPGENVEELNLEKNVIVSGLLKETDPNLITLAVVFSPPDPAVNINEKAQITLKNTANNREKIIEINRAGLIRVCKNPPGCL